MFLSGPTTVDLMQAVLILRENMSIYKLLALIILIILLRHLLLRTRALRKYNQFVLFARSKNCAAPQTLGQGSTLRRLRHKIRILRSKDDIYDEVITRQYENNGDTHTVLKDWTKTPKVIYTVDPKNVQAILATNFADFERPSLFGSAMQPFVGAGILTHNGQPWARSRALVKPQFAHKRTRDIGLFQVHIHHLFQAIGTVGHDGWTDEVDLKMLFYRLTLDTSTEFLLGTGTGSQLSGVQGKKQSEDTFDEHDVLPTDFADAFNVVATFTLRRLQLGKWNWLANDKIFRVACSNVKRTFGNLVADAFTSGDATPKSQLIDKGQLGVLGGLLQDSTDEEEIRNNVMHLLVAGRDTIAATLSWTFAALERYPRVFQRLRSDIISTFGTEVAPRKSFSPDSLKSCIYLQWVVNEILRLYPPGPFGGRLASRDTVLPTGGGPEGKSPVAVPKGALAIYSVFHLHRRKESWGEDSWDFRPERWENRRLGWEYLPFSNGPQGCIGQHWAHAQITYVVARLLQHFDRLETITAGQDNLKKGTEAILSPANGVKMRLHLDRQSVLEEATYV